MKQHAEIGALALEDAAAQSDCCGFLKTATEIARYHHERFDGGGYPVGLEGHAIPLSARIVAVADVFDALTSERVYKKAMSPTEARMLMCSESGSHFDPEIIEAFNACWDQFLTLASESQAGGHDALEEAETIVSRSSCHVAAIPPVAQSQP
jgi:putative two-component system response regulator